ncbi:MAG: RIO1 family regulatory kinase/ATPase [Mycobacteriales bacterium]
MATVRPDGPIRPRVASAPGERRRRPSGEPPPLPRDIPASTHVYAALVLATVALEVVLALHPLRRWVTAGDLAVLRLVERLRVEPLTDLLRGVAHLGSPWVVRVVFWGTLVVLVVTRRLHHVLTYLVVVLLTFLLVTLLAVAQGRMRPAGVEILGDWTGYAHPAVPVALLALVLVGVRSTLLPAGRWRARVTTCAAVLVGSLCLAGLYLGTDHPTDLLAALGLGWALPMVCYRVALPDEVFPVRYRGGTRAHVQISGRRGAAVVRGLGQQLGLQATSLEPFGLAGSAGSMPMRIHVRQPDGTRTTLFGKLYTVTHLRSDRWYKLGRMVLYGRLEDEKPFSTVRRLVEYEDHLLRLLRDARLPVPAPYGIVEITPEREYLVLMEFFEGAQEIGQVTLTDEEVDDGLRIVRTLWDAGVAHRDLKPSNLLVRDGRVLLIDVAFSAVRPTPWRQAVDLANMMLTLALSSSAERVYARALRQFAPEDVAEAFAASRGVTLPTQLRARLKADGRDLAGRFRELAPRRPPVAIQLWTVRRVLVTLSVVVAAALAVAALGAYAKVANLL